MKSISIKNFTLRDEMEVVGSNHDTLGPLVSLIQRVGSVHFQHSMTPAQAREMAAALITHANALDA